MVIPAKQYINLDEDSPLDMRLTERPVKAYMVAKLAFIDGAEASAEHYEISLASVYAAMLFYEENREAIEQELAEIKVWLEENAIDGKDAIAKFKKRMADQESDE